MLACDLREKGEDDDDLEISLVVIVVEESRINQVAFTREKKEKRTIYWMQKSLAHANGPLRTVSFHSLPSWLYALCMYTRRERERKKEATGERRVSANM
jgi:hypothetical protein